jgi:hypothetical protein
LASSSGKKRLGRWRGLKFGQGLVFRKIFTKNHKTFDKKIKIYKNILEK